MAGCSEVDVYDGRWKVVRGVCKMKEARRWKCMMIRSMQDVIGRT